ncbi:MAG TPA: NAD-dependent epimerase/dehydratase family protein [Actinobacteria bacterium]|nr:NAD-dependent epimerase/dehydratase family protein [Actinomycetota bacterium]
MSKETVLVTGGAGFIGSNLVDAYLDADYGVVVVDDLSRGKRENVNPKAIFHQIDINDSRMAGIFSEFKPTIVNHHAAQASVRVSVDDPVFDADINIIGSLRLLELARQYEVKKVIFASTGGAIYGEQDYFPADEGHALRPISPYGAAKAAVELYLGYYYAQYKLAYTALRYSNVFGPRQDPFGEAGVVAIFSKQMLNGEKPVINGDGLQTRDYVYVADVVAANTAASKSSFVGAINIGTGIETSVIELFRLLKTATGFELEAGFGPAKPGEQARSVLNAGKALDKLGWKSNIALSDGLARTVNYFR